MKKLKLNLQNLEGAEVLTREQLKMVMGGFEQGSGCGNVITDQNGNRCVFSGVSKQEAIQNSYDFNTGNYESAAGFFGTSTVDVNWCCSSCGNFDECLGDA